MPSGTHHSRWSWKFSKLRFVRMSPFDLSTVKTPSCTGHSAGPPPADVQADRSLPSKKHDGIGRGAVRPAVARATTAGCGVQYSDMPGVIGSCRG